jgi:hypothetical protein
MKNHYQYRFILACFVIASQLVFYAAPALSSELPHTGGPVVEETSEPIVEEPVPAPEPVVEEPAPEPPAEESQRLKKP